MSDLLAFLRARLDEDERVAQAADPGPWEVGPNWGARDSRVYVREQGSLLDWVGQVFAAQVSNKDRPRENAAHIALHDPARVLREVEAKRLLIDDITAERHLVVEDDCWYTCPAATEERDGGESCDDDAGDECRCGRDARVERRLRLFALPYSDHPAYRPEWRP